MQVLILSQYFWPESFRINAFALALREAGADVTVLTGHPNYPDGNVFAGYEASTIRHEKFAGVIDVIRVPMVPRGRGTAVRLVLNYCSFVLSAGVIGPWLLRRRKVDVVFVYAPSPILQAIPGILLSWVKSARLVTWVQDLWPESLVSTGFVTNRALLAVVDRVVRSIYRRNDLLLAQSRAFVTAMRPKAGRTPVEYFPNPGEGDGGDETSAVALTLPKGFNVVFAGNLGTVQSLETILDAAELLRDAPDVRLVLIGSGSRSAWLEREVAERSLNNVLLTGRFPSASMPGILAQASALLVALSRSVILSQTVPAKMQTCLAAGRPVIASLDGEGADLVLRAGAGVAAPAEDARALADCVLQLRAMSAVEQARMGAAARSFYEHHFQPDVLAERLLGIFRALTDGPRVGPPLTTP
ncbi:MAG: glycosyltransferase family 4 protein [Gemmatimonadaceae bacterium]